MVGIVLHLGRVLLRRLFKRGSVSVGIWLLLLVELLIGFWEFVVFMGLDVADVVLRVSLHLHRTLFILL